MLTEGTVSGIVLAAGSSTRLGRPKQTLPFGDTTLLGWVVRNAERSSLDAVVVVLGAAAQAVQSELRTIRARVVVNESYATGSASSLQKGLNSTEACSAAMLLLGDMPEVDETIIDVLRRTWAEDRPWALVSEYRGVVGHPFVISSTARPAVRALRGDKALWRLLERHHDRVQRLPIDRPLPVDVDTWDDLLAARGRLGVGHKSAP